MLSMSGLIVYSFQHGFRLVNTEFSTVRFYGDKEKADSVYKGMQPLVAQDIGMMFDSIDVQIDTNDVFSTAAEIIVFTAGRPPHVNIADSLVFPTAQADATTVHRIA